MISMYEIITKKKHGEALTEGEIRELITEYTAGNIPDYQMSSLLMAICFNGMNDDEIAILTDAMANSGDTTDLSEFGRLAVDKHSTGGVGDKTTLVVAPIAASLGCKLAKMSGRGLGHTGGTVDKLESFPGYDTSLSPEDFFAQVRKIGIAVIGQSGNLAPADKKKTGSTFDLPILISILSHSVLAGVDLEDACFIGELSLSGEVRECRGALCMCLAARAAGKKRIFLPS